MVWKLDRLGRSIQGLISLAADLSARKVDFRSLTDGFGHVHGLGPAPLPYPRLGGRDGARADQGADCRRPWRRLGRRAGSAAAEKSALTPDKLDTARKLLAAGDKPAKVAKLLQVGLSTFYRHFPAGERAGS